MWSNQRIEKLRAEIVEIDPSEFHLITQKQQEINAIQRIKSANLVTILQQKTKDLLREQDSLQTDELSLSKLISPSLIEPETTTSHQNDPAGGVFSQTLEPNSSLLCRRLRESDLSKIKI
jgi:hypothetical protein